MPGYRDLTTRVVCAFVTSLFLLHVPLDSSAAGSLEQGTLLSGGITRRYLLFIPGGTEKDAHPLVIALHGGGGDGKGMIGLTKGRFNELADERRFFVVYPDGVNKGWNDGREDPSLGSRDTVDDVRFLIDLVHSLARRFPVDTGRVAIAGISNGGMMSLRLACTPAVPARIIAAVAASLPSVDVPLMAGVHHRTLMLFDGTGDPTRVLIPHMHYMKRRGTGGPCYNQAQGRLP